MSTKRLMAAVALGACLSTAIAAGPSIAAAAAPEPAIATTTFPQPSSARSGAAWLAGQLTPSGYIPGNAPGQANLSFTANTVLALASAGVDLSAADSALAYLEANVDQYVTVSGTDGASQLALLILDAHALGADPHAFGRTDLVSRLLATEQPSGLFGAQDPTYDGAYRQGLALAALAAVGVTSHSQLASADSWLSAQQCPNGGWSSDVTINPCTGAPSNFLGADTNTTAVAVEGLVAQDAIGATSAAGALAYLSATQDGDGGWGYYANPTSVPGPTDPDSTGLVVQALVALGVSPTGSSFARASGNPVTALGSFQLTSGAGAGGFEFSPGGGADLTATFEAVPAMAGVTLPFEVGRGYWQVASDGGVFSYGTAHFYGSAGGLKLNKPIVGMAPTQDGSGYWLVASDGGVFSFGGATFYGSTGAMALNRPIVGMAAAPDSTGYWLVASDGGVFSFGDATFYGSTGAMALNRPIVGMAATPDGKGYWLVASDGGVFSFGDATFYGSTGAMALNRPVVGMAATPDGKGYWLVASDGGVFSFGDATFYGSTGAMALNRPIVGLVPTPDGTGYWLVAADGGVFTYGDALFWGSAGGTALNRPVVGASSSDGPGGS